MGLPNGRKVGVACPETSSDSNVGGTNDDVTVPNSPTNEGSTQNADNIGPAFEEFDVTEQAKTQTGTDLIRNVGKIVDKDGNATVDEHSDEMKTKSDANDDIITGESIEKQATACGKPPVDDVLNSCKVVLHKMDGGKIKKNFENPYDKFYAIYFNKMIN